MARVKCQQCHHINPDGLEKCELCGRPLPRINIKAASANPKTAEPHRPGEEAIQFRRGQVIDNRYTVLNLIGRGGMGCIYKVHDNTLGEDVALKTLLPQFAKDKQVVERFLNEARIARRLAHPNIVRVHDIGQAGSVIYISMEYLEGKSLRGLLEMMPSGMRMPVKQVLHIMDELCGALDYAHQYTIHRDIKPENVMIDLNNCVKLMDFGISKLMANTRLTGASIIMGTPFYMSPEQLRNSREVDARADIYSVGVMLYEVLTGIMPTGVPRPASEMVQDLPPALDQVVAKCVEPDREKRCQNAKELRKLLAPIRTAVAAGTELSQIATQHQRRSQKRLVVSALSLLIVLAVTLGGLFFAEQHRHRVLSQFESMPTISPVDMAQQHQLDALHSLLESSRTHSQRYAIEEGMRAALLENASFAYQLAVKQLESGTAEEQISRLHSLIRRYLAVEFWEEGMLFIPDGTVSLAGQTIHVPAFLIDKQEVRLETYWEFCESNQWPLPVHYQNAHYELDPDAPITQVTCFDAQAFAASQAKWLPTEAQWACAAFGNAKDKATQRDSADTECQDMAESVSEWTRSAAPESYADFGGQMQVRGGNFQTLPSLHQVMAYPYDYAGPLVGFRCVRELPVTEEAVQRLRDAMN